MLTWHLVHQSFRDDGTVTRSKTGRGLAVNAIDFHSVLRFRGHDLMPLSMVQAAKSTGVNVAEKYTDIAS